MNKILLTSLLSICGILFAIYNLFQGYYGLPEYFDDAYYYIHSAKNHAVYGFYSIDGMNPTNGFHPLWMGIVTLFYEWGGLALSKPAQVFALKAIEMSLYLAALSSAVYLYNKERRYPNLFLGAALLLTTLPGLSLWGKGMESTLACLWAIWIVHFILQEKYGACAALMPLLFLSRLDSALYVITPFIFYIGWKTRSAKIPLLVMLPTALTGAAYSALNYFSYGELMPISGQLKSSFPLIHFQWTQILDPILLHYQAGSLKAGIRYFLQIPNMAFLTLAVAALAVCILWRRQKDLYFLLWAALSLAGGLLLFQKWTKGFEVWYFALPYLFVSMMGVHILCETASRKILGIVITSLAVLSGGYYAAKSASLKKPDFDLEKMWHNLPEDSILACTDMGYMAFWGPNKIVNLDGLINNREYQEFLRDGNLVGYLRKNHVNYLLVGLWDQEPQWQFGRETEKAYKHRVCPEAFYNSEYAYDFFMYSYLFGTYSDTVRLTHRQEVLRTPSAKDGGLNARIVIFDLSKL